MSSSEVAFHVPLKFRKGALREDERASVDSGHALVDYSAKCFGWTDLEGRHILDFGCGVKVAQALLERDAIGFEYDGLDVGSDMIEYLQANINDPRFLFDRVNFQNDMYNPGGTEIGSAQELASGLRGPYDGIWMFSVITHMAPKDLVPLFSLLRSSAAADGKLLFSCFIDDEMDQDFLDHDKRPLYRAFYRSEMLHEALTEAGWTVDWLRPPLGAAEGYTLIQSHFLCSAQ